MLGLCRRQGPIRVDCSGQAREDRGETEPLGSGGDWIQRLLGLRVHLSRGDGAVWGRKPFICVSLTSLFNRCDRAGHGGSWFMAIRILSAILGVSLCDFGGSLMLVPSKACVVQRKPGFWAYATPLLPFLSLNTQREKPILPVSQIQG